MARILASGVATLDIINTVNAYPEEDAKIRATGQRVCRGGNAVNTLVVLSLLNHSCSWGGTLGGDYAADIILEDLKSHHIDYSACDIYKDDYTPTSYILLNTDNGSRTIVHYRSLPEFSLASFMKISLDNLDWIHFEGRNILETENMLRAVKATHPAIPCSLEVEKSRPNIERLFSLVDVLIFSHECVQRQEVEDAPAFLRHMHTKYPHADLICPWCEQGAYGLNRQGNEAYSPPFPPSRVVDSLGAGDTFNAGIIDAYTKQYALPEALSHACHLAGKKCGHHGLDFIKAPN